MVKGVLKSKKGFYVGDICYVLDDDIYDGVWGAHGYADGCYDTELGKFAVGSTAYGDGCYDDQYGHRFPVDAGVIGIVPWEILEKQKKWRGYGTSGTDEGKLNGLGYFMTGETATFYATCRDRDAIEQGMFCITVDDKSITIRTEDDYPDYDEDEEEDYYDSEEDEW